MGVMANERPAIDTLLKRLGVDGQINVEAMLREGELPQQWSVDGKQIRFAGVSKGMGLNASSDRAVGVFVLGTKDLEQDDAIELSACDAMVLVRPPTAEEREASMLRRSAMKIVEALTFAEPKDPESPLQLTKLPATETFVTC